MNKNTNKNVNLLGEEVTVKQAAANLFKSPYRQTTLTQGFPMSSFFSPRDASTMSIKRNRAKEITPDSKQNQRRRAPTAATNQRLSNNFQSHLQKRQPTVTPPQVSNN